MNMAIDWSKIDKKSLAVLIGLVHPLQLAQQEARAVVGIGLEVEGRIEGERR